MGQGLKQALPGRIQNGGIYRIHKDNETITENRAGLLPPFDTKGARAWEAVWLWALGWGKSRRFQPALGAAYGGPVRRHDSNTPRGVQFDSPASVDCGHGCFFDLDADPTVHRAS